MIKAKRQNHWWLLLMPGALFLAGCAGIANALNPAQAEPTPLPVVEGKAPVSAEGRVVPETFTTLFFPSPGRLESIQAQEGAEVEKDALLASLGEREQALAAQAAADAEVEAAQQALDDLTQNADLQRSRAALAVEQARAKLVEAQKAYNDTLKREFTDRLDAREETLQDRKTTLDDRKETLDKYLDLDENNPTRVSAQDNYDAALEDYNTALYERDQLRSQRDTAKAALEEARQALAQAQRDLDDLAAGPDPDLKAQAEARLKAAKAQSDAAARALANMDLRAPFAGVLLEVKQLEPGMWVSAGQPVATLADTSNWYIETTDLTELDVVRIHEGDKVSVTLDAIPGEEFTGEVTSVARTYTEKSGDILYKVRIRLENPPADIRWGLTGTVLFGKD